MKTYNMSKRLSPQLKAAIRRTIATNDSYAGCYFWTNTGSARQRRTRESNFADENPPYQIIRGAETITVTPSLSISCANFYYSLEVLRDANKSNILVLKNIIR